MFEPNEELFINKIRENPGEDLPRGIYSDWLEEQGSEKAELVRLFNQAVTDLDALSRLEYFLGAPEDLIRKIDSSLLPSLGVELNWVAVQSAEYIYWLMLSLSFDYVSGKISYTEYISESNNLTDHFTEDDWYDFDFDLHGLIYAAKTEVDSIVWAFNRSLVLSDDDPKCYLVLASFWLFGANVLSDNFIQTGYTNSQD